MKDPHHPPRAELFAQHLEQIQGCVNAVARRRRLSTPDRDELLSFVAQRLLEKEQRVFAALAGCDCPTAFLERIVDRLWIDLTNQRWGRWRPTTKARRLGTTAIELDRLVRRDRLEPASALELLAARRPSGVAEDREVLARELAAQRRPESVALEGLELRSPDHPAGELESERLALSRRLLDVVRASLAALPAMERAVVRLRFLEGLQAPAIAAATGLASAEVYRKLYAGLDRLARELRRSGFGPAVVREVTASDRAIVLDAGCLDAALGLERQGWSAS